MTVSSTTRVTPGHTRSIRIAFYGKTGSEEQALPSLERQLHAVAAALPAHARITCHFADVGVWNSLRQGAQTTGWDLSGHHVLGGLRELLRHAHDAERDFDVVVCVNDARSPRRMAERLAVEDELAECGIGVAALDSVHIAHLLEPSSMRQDHWRRRLGDWCTTGAPTRHGSFIGGWR